MRENRPPPSAEFERSVDESEDPDQIWMVDFVIDDPSGGLHRSRGGSTGFRRTSQLRLSGRHPSSMRWTDSCLHLTGGFHPTLHSRS